MTATNTLITFVIPTRNRQDCLRSMLQTFSRFHQEKCTRFDVVILDNSDDDSLAKDVENCQYAITYVYRAEQLSVVDNFNQGTALLTGTYACFMGDDDLISERIFDLAALMDEHEIDAAILAAQTKGVYFWPGVVDARWGDVGGTLFLGNPSGYIQPIILDDAIRKSRAHSCDGPQLLPRVYSGLIAKSCIDEVIARYGTLFGGCSPDIYSSRMLSSVVKKIVAIDLPVLLAGASKTSTSAQRAERSDVGQLKSNDHLGRFQNLVWSPRIPEFYSPFTVWAQSYLQAEERLGSSLDDSDLAYVYAKCLLFARGNAPAVLAAMHRSSSPAWQTILTALSLLVLPFRFVAQKLPLLLNRRPGGCRYAFVKLETSYDASLRLDDVLRTIQMRLAKARA
ncbi:glycosyltransferase [Undibacterium sp.]|uniref:glycosyltransferase n=1 Tax=Undibacterium sp. TaxID=1914977 RepID=UPI0037531519